MQFPSRHFHRVLLLWVVAALMVGADSHAQQREAGKRHGDLRVRDTLRIGDLAPDFKLKTSDGKAEVQLSKIGDKPVVLAFGSYT